MTEPLNDFYSGFEGEPEIRLTWTRNDGSVAAVRLWEGYFDAIMQLAQQIDGRWSGLALPYHTHEAWYEDEWPIPSLDVVIDQWRTLDTTTLDDRTKFIHAHILEFLEEARSQQKQVWITYD